MDGTLYSWIDYIVPAVEALVGSVERSTGWPRIRIVQALKKVYTKYESNEYPFVLQESEIFEAFPEFGSFDKLVIEPARTAFKDARNKYLQPYPGVSETLEKLKRRGVRVVALTDAPRNPVVTRATPFKLDLLLDAIYCLPGFETPAAPGRAEEDLPVHRAEGSEGRVSDRMQARGTAAGPREAQSARLASHLRGDGRLSEGDARRR